MHSNRLAQSKSPYLLQHAQNPVDWYPWGEEALHKAKREDKPILVSIGYSTCHWCHVMERESFEQEDVAQVMNEHFVCIKIDREERPDLDEIYMSAVQALGQQGGWPLNVFLLPDRRPFYGGTYFPRTTWVQLLLNITQAFMRNREEIEENAQSLLEHLEGDALSRYGLNFIEKAEEFSLEITEKGFERLADQYDRHDGGVGSAPKFPMPSLYEAMLVQDALYDAPQARLQAALTLQKMADGGIYDQAGGGFARYSVDGQWLVPHFEKMGYDNGQLLGLYSLAYKQLNNPRFAEIVHQTADFLAREMTHPEGGFYSALDADSEGEEGKFYLWTLPELEDALGAEDAVLAAAFWGCTSEGNWEEAKSNILHRPSYLPIFAEKHDLGIHKLQEKVQVWEEKLLTLREGRIRPGRDEKIITSWNALTIHGLALAYRYLGDEKFLTQALKATDFVEKFLTKPDGKLLHSITENEVSGDALLDSYATMARAYLALFQVTQEEKWVEKAQKLAEIAQAEFWDAQEGLFFFSPNTAADLIVRRKERFDNVIPSSNAFMAEVLLTLGILRDDQAQFEQGAKMVKTVEPLISKELRFTSYWAKLHSLLAKGFVELVITGEGAKAAARAISPQLPPNVLVMSSEAPAESTLPLLQLRASSGKKLTYHVCRNKACQLPVYTESEALGQI